MLRPLYHERMGTLLRTMLLMTALGGVFCSWQVVQAAHTASLSYTIDGVTSTEVAAGGSNEFAVTVAHTGGDPITQIIPIIFKNSGNPVLEISSVNCPSGWMNVPMGEASACMNPAGSTSDATISFTAVVPDTLGSYTVAAQTQDLLGSTATPFAPLAVVAGGGSVFEVDAVISEDLDGNGYIDAFTIGFSDGTEGASAAVDATSLDIGDVSIDGYAVTNIATSTSPLLSGNVIVSVSENATMDTGSLPETVVVQGISDKEGTEVDETTILKADMFDGARPHMSGATVSGDGTSIEIGFSEDLLDGSVDVGDFSLSSGSVDSVSEVGGVVTLTLVDAVSQDVDVTVANVQDLNSNVAQSHTITAAHTPAAAPDTDPISIQSVSLSTSAVSTSAVGAGDTITLMFELSEAAAAATTTVEDSFVEPSVVGTTYTSTYTVDASDEEGPVTFEILVRDAAGNETSTTQTTDASSAVISFGQEETSSLIPFSIDLVQGLNLISLPVTPADTSIDAVLGSAPVEAVWSYDSESSQQWRVYYPDAPELSNLTALEPGYGYWVRAYEAGVINGEGTAATPGAQAPPSRTLEAGWQLVGYYQPSASATGSVSVDTAFASIGTAGVDYTSLLAYDAALGIFTSPLSVSPGQAFWMFLQEAGAELSISTL